MTSINVDLSALPSVQQIARAFSQAAQTYDQVAGLQRLVADDLLARGQMLHAGKVLDIGSGTGYVSAHLADRADVVSVTGIDIAQGMLDFASRQHTHGKLSWLLGDAQNLPSALGTRLGSFDTVVSSLAIQWCGDLGALFSGVAQSLTPTGVFHAATLGPNTLHQLKWAWAQADDYQHVNEFVAKQSLLAALNQHFDDVELHVKEVVLSYDTVQQLTRDLKELGASNHNAQAAPGLTGVGRLRRMMQAYESLRDENGQLPITYEVYFITARPACGRINKGRENS
ncbi:MAG: malonyl-ACP O-methyltransferase BioC [Oceanospirillaceae bacterium]|jgi:malonyl-CoA O-methyltransferase|nr:malonyl-ACP O-methyltransferase BioC [Oceanospirillaceae bacterium]MBT4442365.1 malonyl-ACP O-methyltransferase BioC [Oceanospirillaceae bacterium]MBT6078252.1 malonyl-ACP O-methyltransferase BioC [Oceanospirillaceae bacterium]